jgi:hypothetical protein
MFKVFAGLTIILGLGAAAMQPGQAQEPLKTGTPIAVPSVSPAAPAAALLAPAYPDPAATKGKTFVAPRTGRGTTTRIPEEDVIRYCSDKAGCNVHIGMHNWDDQGRVASRKILFFYNKDSGVWRADLGDIQGTNNNNITEHVNNSWSCYFTDGQYANWVDQGDTTKDFGVLSWNQYNADCWVTLMVN